MPRYSVEVCNPFGHGASYFIKLGGRVQSSGNDLGNDRLLIHEAVVVLNQAIEDGKSEVWVKGKNGLFLWNLQERNQGEPIGHSFTTPTLAINWNNV